MSVRLGGRAQFLEEYSHSSAPALFLAALSQRTRKIRLGHGILQTSPLYNHLARKVRNSPRMPADYNVAAESALGGEGLRDLAPRELPPTE